MSEQYNHIVECIYLTIVNDRRLHSEAERRVNESVMSKTNLEAFALYVYASMDKSSSPVAYAARENDIDWRGIASYEYRDIWVKLVEHYGDDSNIRVFIDKFNDLADITKPLFDATSAVVQPMRTNLMNEISNHTIRADLLIDSSINNFNQSLKETKLMNELNNTPFKSVSYVYGQDIEKLDAQGLMNAIKRSNSEIVNLKATDVKSKYIDNQVKVLESAIEKMVATLDAIEVK